MSKKIGAAGMIGGTKKETSRERDKSTKKQAVKPTGKLRAGGSEFPKIMIYLPPEVEKALRIRAIEEGKTISGLCEDVLRAYLGVK